MYSIPLLLTDRRNHRNSVLREISEANSVSSAPRPEHVGGILSRAYILDHWCQCLCNRSYAYRRCVLICVDCQWSIDCWWCWSCRLWQALHFLEWKRTLIQQISRSEKSILDELDTVECIAFPGVEHSSRGCLCSHAKSTEFSSKVWCNFLTTQ